MASLAETPRAGALPRHGSLVGGREVAGRGGTRAVVDPAGGATFAEVSLLDGADLESVGESRVGDRIEVGTDHHVAEAGRRVAALDEEGVRAVVAGGARLEERRRGRRMLVEDFDGPRLDGSEHRPADPPPPERRIEEADHLVEPRSVGLVRPFGPGVADQATVDLDGEEVAGLVAVLDLERVVERGEAVERRDEVDAVRFSRAVRDVVHGRVVGDAGEVPEAQAGDRRQGCLRREVGGGVDGHSVPFGR